MLLNTLQLIALLPLLSLTFPVNFIEYAKFLAVVNGELGGIPNIFEELVFSNDDLVQGAFNSNYELMGKPRETNDS